MSQTRIKSFGAREDEAINEFLKLADVRDINITDTQVHITYNVEEKSEEFRERILSQGIAQAKINVEDCKIQIRAFEAEAEVLEGEKKEAKLKLIETAKDNLAIWESRLKAYEELKG